MRVKGIYCIYDTVSETVTGEYIANNDTVAKKAFEKFIEQNKLDVDKDSFKLIQVGSFNSIENNTDYENALDDDDFTVIY